MKNKKTFMRSGAPVDTEMLENILDNSDKKITNAKINIFKWIPLEEGGRIFLGPKTRDPKKYDFEYSTIVEHEGTTYYLHPSVTRQV